VASLSYPTRAELPSPILIDTSQLEALDALIDRHEANLREYAEKRLNELVMERMEKIASKGNIEESRRAGLESSFRTDLRDVYSFDKVKRHVILYLPHGAEIRATRYHQAINEPSGQEVIPQGFMFYLKLGGIEVTVKQTSGDWSTNLSIKVEPNDAQVSQELFGALSNWAADIEAPRWQQLWVKYSWMSNFLIILTVMIGLMLPLANWQNAGPTANKAAARKLLSEGINPGNEQRAMALLLAIESDYDPGARPEPIGLRYWTYLSFLMLFLLVASIPPKNCLGIWRGKRRLQRWRWWTKMVGVTIPALIATSILLPWIIHWLGLGAPGT
jgi:hypothetical protein